MFKLAIASLILISSTTASWAQSHESVAASAEASRASVEAVGAGIAAVGTLVMIPPMAVAEVGKAIAEDARNAPLPLGESAVTAGPAPDLAVRK